MYLLKGDVHKFFIYMAIPFQMLLKFAYDGTKFYGYQRQTGLRTVEGEILKVLQEYGIADKIRSASRTDRGVSALGNVISIGASMKPRDVIGILNSNLRDIFFHSYVISDENPRFARMRWYRYHLPPIYDLSILRDVARIFQGEHDFRNFTRARNNTVLKIDKIEVKEENGTIVVDFFARYYLWNLIRRIVAAMESYASGKVFDEEVFEKKTHFGLAPPEPLILMDVQYDFPFTKIKIRDKILKKFFNRFAGGLVYYYLSKP